MARAGTAWSPGLWTVSTDTNTCFKRSGSSVARTFSRVFSRKVSATLGSKKGSRTGSEAQPMGPSQTGLPARRYSGGHLPVWTQNKTKTLEPDISYQIATSPIPYVSRPRERLPRGPGPFQQRLLTRHLSDHVQDDLHQGQGVHPETQAQPSARGTSALLPANKQSCTCARSH